MWRQEAPFLSFFPSILNGPKLSAFKPALAIRLPPLVKQHLSLPPFSLSRTQQPRRALFGGLFCLPTTPLFKFFYEPPLCKARADSPA